MSLSCGLEHVPACPALNMLDALTIYIPGIYSGPERKLEMIEHNIFPVDPNAIVEIPCHLIEADHSWNHRSGDWTTDSGDEEVNQLEGLADSIAEDGQQEPVTVTLTGNPEKPYALRKGFRRYEAIKLNSIRYADMPAVMRCIVVDLDPVEARLVNLRENVRDNVKPADFCWGVKQLNKELKTKGEKLTAADLSRRLGMNASYMSKILRIAEKCKQNVFDRWRMSPVSVSVADMVAVSELPKDEQDQAFADLLGIDVGEGGEGLPPEKKDWVPGVKKQGGKIAYLLGVLEAKELINTDGLDFDDHLEMLVKLPKGAKANQRKSIAAHLRKEYEKAGQAAEEEAEDESELPEDQSDDEKPRRRKS